MVNIFLLLFVYKKCVVKFNTNKRSFVSKCVYFKNTFKIYEFADAQESRVGKDTN